MLIIILQLGYNNLKSFPTVVTRMEKLEELSLIHNQISVLPDEVSISFTFSVVFNTWVKTKLVEKFVSILS